MNPIDLKQVSDSAGWERPFIILALVIGYVSAQVASVLRWQAPQLSDDDTPIEQAIIFGCMPLAFLLAVPFAVFCLLYEIYLVETSPRRP